MVAFHNGTMYHELEIEITQDEIFDDIPLKDLINHWGVDEILEHMDKNEIVEYLSKNGYQIAEEQ